MSNFSLSEESKYNVSDPLALFYDLTLDKKNTILLESLEVHTKAGTTSLLGINSALKFSCLDRVVTIEILNENGLVAAEDLIKLLPANDISVLSKNEKEIKILFKEIDQNQDEDSRLKATTVLDTLRKALMLNPKFGKKEDLILAGV
ncbi:MAG: anthranilate synthase component I, partial [Succinivibrionaceae bacterium]|nr:anthranilate synthase component I [Succinivibrionaceae bacterium]